MRKHLFTSESVSKGHPDKVSDKISDAILDAYLEQDENSKVACEVLVTTNFVVISGEINSQGQVDVEKVARNTIKEIGYDFSDDFKWNKCEIINKLHQQSPDINQGVDKEDGETGAGDQGIMFGYAVNEGNNYMPYSLEISNAILLEIDDLRNKQYDYIAVELRPDAKSQVTIEYEENKPQKIDTIVVSIQHSEKIELDVLKKWVEEVVIERVKKYYNEKLFKDFKLIVNPTGKFVVGGPDGDTGLTGRKIVVDQYGGKCPVGGGAFSGKDPSKVDRSAAYAARWVAKNIVASGIAEECLIQLSYAIGVAKPTSIYINTFGTSKIPDEQIEDIIKQVFPLTPDWINEKLELKNPIYKDTAAYGHFGREGFAWEKLNLTEDLKDQMYQYFWNNNDS